MKIEANELHRLYWDEGLTLKGIARLCDSHPTTVLDWFRKAGIPTRTRGESLAIAYRIGSRKSQSKRPPDDELRRRYVDEGKTLSEIGSIYGVTLGRVSVWCKDAGIECRKPVEFLPKARAASVTPEARRKRSEAIRGEKNYMWRGGVSGINRLEDWQWRMRRKECYHRDEYKCQDCGVHCTSVAGPQRIQAHHVIPRRLGGGNELENLVTLCTSCHHKRERRYADAMIV